MATFSSSNLPRDIEDYKEYERCVRRSLETSNANPGTVVMTFNYLRVKAVRVAMKVALRRGEIEDHWSLH